MQFFIVEHAVDWSYALFHRFIDFVFGLRKPIIFGTSLAINNRIERVIVVLGLNILIYHRLQALILENLWKKAGVLSVFDRFLI